MILGGQTEIFADFSLIFADSRLFLENKAFGKRRFSQKTADFSQDFRRKPQDPAENRSLAFVPLVRGFEKGLAGGGWRQTNPQKEPKKFSRNVSPFF